MANTFDRYLIESKLGQGGMGAVYLAIDQSLGRRVALKVITSDDKESLARFQREAQAVAKLKHPNIVQVYDVGTAGSRPYFTMEYIEGISLEKMMSASPKPALQKIVNIILQIAQALDYAHSHKLIHRDIKPGNILIDKDSKAYLTDFGIAKSLTGLDRKITMTGTVIGTTEYMSPEQTQGKNNEIDQRSDIFSLGAMLYFCITGRLPFEGRQIYEMISNIINKDPPPPTTIIRWIPKDLETICLKCLEKDRAKRYQTAGELAEDLKRYLSGEPILARRAMYIQKLWYKAKKNRATSLAIATVMVVFAGILAYWLVATARAINKVKEYSRQAEEYFEQGKYEDTRIFCTKILGISPVDKDAIALRDKCAKLIEKERLKAEEKKKEIEATKGKLQLRADAKIKLDGLSRATSPGEKIRVGLAAIEIDPSYSEAYQAIGFAYEEIWDYDEAFKYFNKAIEANPTLAYSYHERGIINYFVRNRFEDAIEDFTNVIKYDPEGHLGYFSRGMIESYQNKHEQAIKSYTESIRIYPQYYQAYLNRGVAYYNLDKLDEAIGDYIEAIGLNPKGADAYANRGAAYRKKAERALSQDSFRELINKVMTDYNEAIRINDKYAMAYRNRGNLYKQMNEIDKAIDDYNTAIRLDPRDAEVYNDRGITYADKGEIDKAMEDYNMSISLNHKLIQPFYNRGNAYSKKKEWDRAIADFTEVIRLDPSNASAYNNRGVAYLNKGELDNAISDCNQVIKLNPKHVRAYSNRAMAYYTQGKFDSAIADCNEAIKLNQKFPEAYFNRAISYAKKGNFKAAIADGETLIKLSPIHPSAQEIIKVMPQWREQLK